MCAHRLPSLSLNPCARDTRAHRALRTAVSGLGIALLAAGAIGLTACGPPPGEGPDGCGVPPLAFDPQGEVIQASDERGACARLERRSLAEPGMMYMQYPYQPLRLVARSGGTFLDVAEGDALSYRSTHHNWQDEMSATAPDGAGARVVFRHLVQEGSWVLELSFLDEDGAELEGPLTLQPQSLGG